MTCHVLLLVAALLPATVQGQTAEVRGRVVETGTRRAITAADVSVEGGGNVRSDQDGEFRLRAVRTGRVALRVTALGYETAEIVLVLARDTSLVIELEPAPIALDAVEGRARNIAVRGEVRDRASNAVLMRSEVAVGERSTQTDLLGRFRLNRLLAGEPLTVEVRAFGYLPATLSVTASRDTTLHFLMDPDPVMQRMIAAQVARLDARYRPMQQPHMPPIDRTELLKWTNATVLDMLRAKYGSSLERIRCVLIDDVQRTSSGAPFARASDGVARFANVGVGTELFASMLPDELERIEVMQSGSGRPVYMLRIYTRRFIARMTGGGVQLAKPFMAEAGLCR